LFVGCPFLTDTWLALEKGRSMQTGTITRPATTPDYEVVFQQMPGLCLILDTAFNIIAQNDEHARVTETQAVGHNLFAAFPDNPNDSGAVGLAKLRQSLLKVMKTRQADILPMLRYDFKPARGPYRIRYWSVTNAPILGEDGYVRWILIRAEDVTELTGEP
jgi:PAS domain-containing protein